MSSKKQKDKKINLWVIIILVVLVIAIIVGIVVKNAGNDDGDENVVESPGTEQVEYVEEIEDGVKINTSTKLNEAKQVDGLTITNIQLTTKNGMSTLLADVINNTDETTDLKTIELTLLDYNGEEIVTSTGIIDSIEPGETTQLNISMTSDYVNAYDFSVRVK